MPLIKFIRNASATESEGKPPKLGEEIEVSEASAQRWVRRGAAEIVTTKPKQTQKRKVIKNGRFN